MNVRSTIVCMLFVLLAVVAGMAALNGWTADGEQSADYEYLDLVPLSDFGTIEAISGPCEIETYSGVQYVRMTGVGTVQTVSGSVVKDYTVGKAHMDLILLTGQSNSYYWSMPEYYDGLSPLPPGTGYYFGTEDVSEQDYFKESTALATWDTIDEAGFVDMTAPDGSVRVACSYPAILYDWWMETGHKAVIASSGVGGHGINSFYLSNGICHRWTVAVLEAIKEKADGLVELNPVAVLWSHGGSDRENSVNHYISRFSTVLGWFLDGHYGIAFREMFCTIPKYPHYDSPINPAVALEAVASVDDRLIIASILPLYLPDNVSGRPDDGDVNHYNQRMYSLMGEAFARAMAEFYGYEPVPETLYYIEPLGEVSELPAEVQARGSSGEAVTVPVSWSGAGTDPGTYDVTGAITVPFGYEAAYGLQAAATLTVAG